MSISPKFPPIRRPCGDLEEGSAHHAIPSALLRTSGYHRHNSQSMTNPVGIIPNVSGLRAGSTTPQGSGLPDPSQKSILKPSPQLDPGRVSVESSPSVRCQNLISGGKPHQPEGWTDGGLYPTIEEKSRCNAKAAD